MFVLVVLLTVVELFFVMLYYIKDLRSAVWDFIIEQLQSFLAFAFIIFALCWMYPCVLRILLLLWDILYDDPHPVIFYVIVFTSCAQENCGNLTTLYCSVTLSICKSLIISVGSDSYVQHGMASICVINACMHWENFSPSLPFCTYI